MKKYNVFLLFIIGIILVGCAENPALIGLKEEVQEASESDESNPETTKEKKVVDSPPEVYVSFDDHAGTVRLDVWCWKEESLCSLEPNPPSEELYGVRPIFVKAGKVFEIIITLDGIPETDHIYNPDIIELKQIRLGEETEVEVSNKKITAPTEKGRYYYSLKLQWDGEVVGQAFYAFSINVN